MRYANKNPCNLYTTKSSAIFFQTTYAGTWVQIRYGNCNPNGHAIKSAHHALVIPPICLFETFPGNYLYYLLFLTGSVELSGSSTRRGAGHLSKLRADAKTDLMLGILHAAICPCDQQS